MTRKESAKRRKMIAADVRAGMPVGQAATKHGASVPTARDACREAKVLHTAKRGKKKHALLRIISQLQKGTYMMTEIGELRSIGVSRAYVSKVAQDARREGIKLHARYRRKRKANNARKDAT